MKTVYLYDNNGIYLYPEQCYPSGLEPGLFIEPTNSTEIEPPTAGVNQVAQFIGGTWVLTPSHLGEIWYDQTTGLPTIITEIGQPTSNLAIIPPPTILLSNAKAAQIVLLQKAYQAAIDMPIAYTTVDGVTDTFPTDATSVSNLEKVLLAHSTTSTFPLNLWVAANNSIVTPFTYADLQGLAAAIDAIDEPDYQHLLTLIAQVQAITTTPADVQLITW